MEFPEIVPDTGNKKPWEETDKERALSEFLRSELEREEREEGVVSIIEAPPSPVGTPVDDSSDSDSDIETDESSKATEGEACETGRTKFAILLKLFAAFIGVATVFICLHLFVHRAIEWQITFAVLGFAVLGPAVVVPGLVLVWKAARFFRSKIPVAYNFLRPRLDEVAIWTRRRLHLRKDVLITSLVVTLFLFVVIGLILVGLSDYNAGGIIVFALIAALFSTLLMVIMEYSWKRILTGMTIAVTVVVSAVLAWRNFSTPDLQWQTIGTWGTYALIGLVVVCVLGLLFKALGPDGVKNWSLALGALVIVLLGVAIGSVYLFNAMEGYTESKRPKDQQVINHPSPTITIIAPVGKYSPPVLGDRGWMQAKPTGPIHVECGGILPDGKAVQWEYDDDKGYEVEMKKARPYPDAKTSYMRFMSRDRVPVEVKVEKW